MKPLFAALLALATYSGSCAGAAPFTPNLPMTASVATGVDIGVGEPIIMKVTISNPTDHSQYVGLGNDELQFVYFGVYDAKGHLVGKKPDGKAIARRYSDFATSVAELKPHSHQDFFCPLNYWYDFHKPGSYTLAFGFNNYDDTPLHLAAQRIHLQVKALPADHFSAKCAQLFEWSRHNHGAVPSLDATSALLSVRNDAALPYFDYLARHQWADEACPAIRRINTHRSRELLLKLSARKDHVGQAARKALKAP